MEKREFVKAGQKIAEIVIHRLNSFAKIFLEKSNKFKVGDILIGGKTVLYGQQ